MKTKLKKYNNIISVLVYILLSLLFLILIKSIKLSEILFELKKIPFRTIIILLILQIFTQLLINYQWCHILNLLNVNNTFASMLYIYARGSIVESITPGAKLGGEFTRLHLLKKDFKCTTTQASSVIAIQKSVSMSVLFLISILSFSYLMISLDLNLSIVSLIITYLIVFILITAMIMMLLFTKRTADFFKNKSNIISYKIYDLLMSYYKSTKLINRREWLKQFLISTIVWGFLPIKMLILMSKLDHNLSIIIIVTITFTSYFAGIIPITPGGSGSFEASLITLLMISSVDSVTSVTATIIFRFITFWYVFICSIIYSLFYKFIKQKVVYKND